MKTTASTLISAFALILSGISFFSVNLANAQAVEKTVTGNQGWYQVEMIIFSRRNPAIQEHFPNNISLHYPAYWQSLKDPNPVTSAETESNSDLTSTTPTNPSTINIDFNTQAFYQLPAEMRQLNLQADKFARSIDYQLLFHQAWRQPVTIKNQADWILIHNTNALQPAPKLAGAIRLSVATYLRLDTNLWFAEFEPAQPEIENPWPELPDNPEVITQDTLGIENDAAIQNISDTQNTITSAVSDATDQTATEAWQTKRIVLLKEKRDMRSNEVHYIDHPVLGIIIKIVPFKVAVTQ